MEMSQRISFWYQTSLKISILWENVNKSLFFGKKISWTGFKNNFELKMFKFLFFFFFFFFFDLGLIFWNIWPKSAKKVVFLAKKGIF